MIGVFRLTRSGRFRVWSGFSFLLLFLGLPVCSLTADDKQEAIERFLRSRIAANNAVEYTFMTERLRDYYRDDRKMKIRRLSTRLIGYRYDPAAIREDGATKTFEVDVTGFWCDFNEAYSGELLERVTFMWDAKQGWLADRLKFIKEQLSPPALMENVQSAKEVRDALLTLKAAMNAWANRDAERARKNISVAFENQFATKDDVNQFFQGTSNPHHVAYEILLIRKLDRDQVEFRVRLYEAYTGKGDLTAREATIVVKEFSSGWYIHSWQ